MYYPISVNEIVWTIFFFFLSLSFLVIFHPSFCDFSRLLVIHRNFEMLSIVQFVLFFVFFFIPSILRRQIIFILIMYVQHDRQKEPFDICILMFGSEVPFFYCCLICVHCMWSSKINNFKCACLICVYSVAVFTESALQHNLKRS